MVSVGALWLGLSEDSVATIGRKTYLQTICEHAAASFLRRTKKPKLRLSTP